MTTEENKALARIWFEEVMTNRNLAAFEEAYASDYVHHDPYGHTIDKEASRRVAESLLAGSNDRRATVVEQIAEGDLVATRWESVGTHTGPMFGRAPTGKPILVRGIVISRIAHSQIVEDWEMTQVITNPDKSM